MMRQKFLVAKRTSDAPSVIYSLGLHATTLAAIQ